MANRDTLNANIQYYRLHAATYDVEEQPFFHQGAFLSKVPAELNGIRERQRVLDFGAGTGKATSVLMKTLPLAEIIGIDVSIEVLEIARHSCPGVVLQRCDGEAIPFPDNHFDGVLASSVIHHIEDYQGALRELVRVCKKDSWIVLTQEPNPRVNKIVNVCRKMFRQRPPELLVAAEAHQFRKEGGVPIHEICRTLLDAGYVSRVIHGNDTLLDTLRNRSPLLYRGLRFLLRLHLVPMILSYSVVGTSGRVMWGRCA